MPLPIVKSATTGRAIARAEPAIPLYDTECIGSGDTTNRLLFYTKTLNDADASGTITSKTLGETNLLTKNQVPFGFRFDLHYINVKFLPNSAYDGAMVKSDFLAIIIGSWFQFDISQIPVAQCLLTSVPFGASMEEDGTTSFTGRIGVAHRSNALMCRMGKTHPTIEGTEQFVAAINWGNSIQTAKNVRVICEAWGVLYKPL